MFKTKQKHYQMRINFTSGVFVYTAPHQQQQRKQMHVAACVCVREYVLLLFILPSQRTEQHTRLTLEIYQKGATRAN